MNAGMDSCVIQLKLGSGKEKTPPIHHYTSAEWWEEQISCTDLQERLSLSHGETTTILVFLINVKSLTL